MPEAASSFLRSLSPEDASSFMNFYFATICTILLTCLPAFVGMVLVETGLIKAGLYLILSNLLLWLSIVYFFLIQQRQSSGSSRYSESTMCCLWTGFAVLIGLTICFIVMLVTSYKKDEVNDYFKVNRVDLTQFELVNASSTLNYTVSVSLRPSLQKVGGGVDYEELMAWAYYQGHSFSSLSSSYYNPGSVTLHLVFQGQHDLVLVGDEMERYRRDVAAGSFSIAVTMSYLGFRSTTGDDMNKANGDYNLVKGAVTFELEDVPLSHGTKGTHIINGGWVAGGGAAS